MKKEYVNPIIEVLSLEKEDVVTTSGELSWPWGDGNEGQGA